MDLLKEDQHYKISHQIPKAELHIHIEGTIEPELVMRLCKKYNKQLFESEETLRKLYTFTCLADFISLCSKTMEVVIDEQDFEDLMYEYLKKASSQGLVYAEIFYGPEPFMDVGVQFETVINGLVLGIKKANLEFKTDASLIICFNRALDGSSALKVLEANKDFIIKNVEAGNICAIGLAFNEIGNPPEKFEKAFEYAKSIGLKACSHACEEQFIPLDYLTQSIDVLKVDRIDHGIHSWKSDEIMEKIKSKQIPLTFCPISNLKLKVFNSLTDYPIRKFMDYGINVSINSDDPSFFGGYIGDNFYEVGKFFNFSLEDYRLLSVNSFNASFISKERKEEYIKSVEKFLSQYS